MTNKKELNLEELETINGGTEDSRSKLIVPNILKENPDTLDIKKEDLDFPSFHDIWV